MSNERNNTRVNKTYLIVQISDTDYMQSDPYYKALARDINAGYKRFLAKRGKKDRDVDFNGRPRKEKG